MADAKNVLARIQTYLGNGGLFNPDLVNHFAVRELIRDCRDVLDASEAARVKAEQERDARPTPAQVSQMADDFRAVNVSRVMEGMNGDLAARITALEAERDALKEALKPFANRAQLYGFPYIDGNEKNNIRPANYSQGVMMSAEQTSWDNWDKARCVYYALESSK